MAHISEIVCRTGLGTVTSVLIGNLVIRTAPGAPGFGEATEIHLPESLRIVTATYGPIPTTSILGNHSLNTAINKCGRKLIARFDRHHAQSSFIHLSRKFAGCLGMMSRRLDRIIGRLDASGVESSMAMLGESLFCITGEEEVAQICSVIEAEHLTPIVTSIAVGGARVL